jgi:hypothetical protein
MKPAATRLTVIATLAALLVLVSAGTAAGAGWRPPVPGAVVRGFDLGANPFEGGRHRGADFAAGPGAPVRAPCAGRVVVARRVGSSGRVVTIRCGPWRVSHMPLTTMAVRPGQSLRRGALLGTAAASREHAGLHLGVRREGVRFGYVDPLRFLGKDVHPPLAGGRRRPRLGPAPRSGLPLPRAIAAQPVSHPNGIPTPDARLGVAPRRRPAVSPDSNPGVAPWRRPAVSPDSNPGVAPWRRLAVSPDSNPGVAPWPAWAGLALFLAGAGVRWRGSTRRRRGSARIATVERVR